MTEIAELIAQARDFSTKLVENESRFFPLEDMSRLFAQLANALAAQAEEIERLRTEKEHTNG